MIHPVKRKRRIQKHRQSLAETHLLWNSTFTWFTLLNVDARINIGQRALARDQHNKLYYEKLHQQSPENAERTKE
jgi:hypothetical protein